jgi:hypothetical protein
MLGMSIWETWILTPVSVKQIQISHLQAAAWMILVFLFLENGQSQTFFSNFNSGPLRQSLDLPHGS